MKKLTGIVFALAVLAAGACSVALVYFPETRAGAYAASAWGFVRDKGLAAADLAVKYWHEARAKFDSAGEERAEAFKKDDVPAKELPVEVDPVVVDDKPQSAPVKIEDGWKGLVDSNHLAGRRVYGRNLKGKVVLVYVWSSSEPESTRLLPRIEDIWKSFNHKPFIVIGSHRGPRNESVMKSALRKKPTFPFYLEAGSARERPPSSYPLIYVVDGSGRIIYRGKSDRSATGVVVEAFSRL